LAQFCLPLESKRLAKIIPHVFQPFFRSGLKQ